LALGARGRGILKTTLGLGIKSFLCLVIKRMVC
jgi:hypothetical protein